MAEAYLFPHILDCVYQESSCSTCPVRNGLSKLWVNLIYAKFGNSLDGMELSVFTHCLKSVQQAFIHLRKFMGVICFGQIDFVEHIQYFTKEIAILHKVVRICHDLLYKKGTIISTIENDCAFAVHVNSVALKDGDQLCINEADQLWPCQLILNIRLSIFVQWIRPVSPAISFRDDRLIIIVQLIFFFLIVKDLQKDKPYELHKSLDITVNARILAHDIL